MKIKNQITLSLLFAIGIVMPCYVQAQDQESESVATGALTAGGEFLLYNTDVRSSAMGNMKSIGITDAFSLYSNPAKLSYQEDILENDISVSYSPVMPKYVNDMNIFSIASNNLIVGGRGQESFLAFGFQYFSIGAVEFTDKQGNVSQFLRPKEMSFNIGYSMEVIEHLHMGVTLKGIYSKLVSSEPTVDLYKSALAGAIDYGLYFEYPVADDAQINAGYVLKNLGTKLKYSEEGDQTGLPTTMNLGLGYTKRIIDDNSYFFIGAEANKPFFPSDRNNTSLLPVGAGGGIGYSVGAELMFRSIFSAMAGYDAKSPEFGSVGYLTTGVGINTYFNAKKLSVTASFLTPSKKEFSSGNIYRLGLSFSILEN
ncbi:MAG: PorV/PorQ family protein [Sphingobacterium sp.]|uniref:PorV/PorQ family protein n=1 Tax=Sphingobacterium sp. JB170 TaxID=1434842 RepID=UPI000B35CF96|nr:PorV/PorQ family protein [Sphingobacterium sp. JB170]